jgi:hypothetical protein
MAACLAPRVVSVNIASIDCRLTLAPGVGLMSGDERWSTMTRGQGDPYLWARDAHHPDLLLEGSGSFLSPAHTHIYSIREVPPPEGEHFLPSDIVNVPGRRWFAVVDGAGARSRTCPDLAGDGRTTRNGP